MSMTIRPGRMPSDVGRAAWLFLAPALVLIFVFFFLPVLASLVLSVTDFDIYAIANPPTTRFVGLANYSKLIHSPEFWQALRNTFYFAIVGGPLTIAVSLSAALLLNAKLVRFKGFFRTIYFTPFVTTLVAVAIVWRYLYHTRYGLLNYTLGHLGIAPIDWLGDPHWAMPAIILMSVWKNFGYNMLIFIAGLQAIPQDLYDAAEIDGAQQGDAVGLTCVAEKIVQNIPPRRSPAHLKVILDTLENAKPAGDTQLPVILNELAETVRQRALVIIISDFFVDPAVLKGCFEHLRFRKHDVAAFHLLDPLEMEFAFQRPVRFTDMEGGQPLFVEPTEIADRYHRALRTYLTDLQRIVLETAVDYHRVITSEAYEHPMMRFLVGRTRGRGVR